MVDSEITKSRKKMVRNELLKFVEKDKWPMRDSQTCQLVREFVLDTQIRIAVLSKQGLLEDAFELMNDFSFDIINRVYTIDLLYHRNSRGTAGIDGVQLLTDSMCMKLLKETTYTKINQKGPSIIKRVYIPKPGSEKQRPLGIGTILDRVLQRMLVNVIDPYYETLYPANMYGYRRGRSQINAVAQIYKYMSRGQERKTVVKLDIKGFFDNIDRSKLKEIRVPQKFRKLTNNWIDSLVFDSVEKDYINVTKGVPQGAIIGPLFSNIILSDFEDYIYQDYPRKFQRVSSTTGLLVSNKCVIYCDDIVLIYNVGDTNVIMNRVREYLTRYGLEISQEKTEIYKFADEVPFKFRYLGFDVRFVPKEQLKTGGLLTRGDSLKARIEGVELGSILISISQENLTQHKQKVKMIIKNSQNETIPKIIDKLNPIIRGFSNYYSFGQTQRTLSWLDGFILKRILLLLNKKKFRKVSMKLLRQQFFDENWRLMGEYKQPKHNDKLRGRHMRKLMKYTEVKVVPIQVGLLTNTVKDLDYYSSTNKYAQRNSKIWEHVSRKRNKEKLYYKQNGLCVYCERPIEDTDMVDVHHLYETNQCKTKMQLAKANRLNNLALLHRSCHRVLHSKNGNPNKKSELIKKIW